MTEKVKFTCPMCGKEWMEEQDTEDDWFRLGTKQTLCAECGQREIRKIKESQHWIIPAEKELDEEEINYLKEHGAAELVRCKDCKNRKDKTKGFCQLATHGWEKENWYCADGVKR